MTSALKMLVQKGIIIFGLSDSTIVLTKSFFQSSTSLSNILHPTIVCISSKTYTRFIDFQSKSESLTTENVLPFTDEVIVVLEHK